MCTSTKPFKQSYIKNQNSAKKIYQNVNKMLDNSRWDPGIVK